MLIVLFQRHRAKGSLLGGFGTPVIASLGLGLGAAFSAGASYRVADYLDGNAVPSPAEFGAEPQLQALQPPVQYQWAAIGFVFMVVVALIAALWVKFGTKPLLERRARPDTDDDYPRGRQRDRQRAEVIDEAIANARLTDHVSRTFVVAWFVVAGAGVVATTLALLDIGPVAAGPVRVGGRPYAVLCVQCRHVPDQPVRAADRVPRRADLPQRPGASFGRGDLGPGHVLAPGRPPAGATVLRRAGRARAGAPGHLARQGAGRCRALRAQPGFGPRGGDGAAVAGRRQDRTRPCSPTARRWTGSTGGPSPTTSAPRSWTTSPPPSPRPTGSRAGSTCGGRTDPIGGPVGTGNRRLADPIDFDPLPGERLPPAVAAHSGYQVTAQFEQAMDDLVGLLPTMIAPAAELPPAHVTTSSHEPSPATDPPVDPTHHKTT